MKLIGPPSKEAAQTKVVKMPWRERTSRLLRILRIIKEKIMFLDSILSPAKFGLAGKNSSRFINLQNPFSGSQLSNLLKNKG